MRPRCSRIFGSTSSPRCALKRSCVPSSSAPIRREYPTTSAARIAARRRVAVVVVIARAALIPARNLTYFARESPNFIRRAASGEFEAASGVYTELQCGSYIFMDADYGRNLDHDGEPTKAFEPSLFVWATVMSRPTEDRAIFGAGLKARAFESGPPPSATSPPPPTSAPPTSTAASASRAPPTASDS